MICDKVKQCGYVPPKIKILYELIHVHTNSTTYHHFEVEIKAVATVTAGTAMAVPLSRM